MSQFIQISEAASIALHGMALLARSTGAVSAVEIAKVTGASENHISKVMQRLCKEEMVSSERGPKGGFKLNRKPEEVSLLDIYECIEGKLTEYTCMLHKQDCIFSQCLFGGLTQKFTNEIKDYLGQKYLSDFTTK